MDDLFLERAARSTWRVTNRLPDGSLRPLSAWRDLAPSIKEREREKLRHANALLSATLALLPSQQKKTLPA